MKVLVVHDSVYGNTARIAAAMAAALEGAHEVRRVTVGEAAAGDLAGQDLVIAGAPTHAFHPSPAMTDWLKALAPGALDGIACAAFDTRIAPEDIGIGWLRMMVKMFGYAAPHIGRRLESHGGRLVVPPEGFMVTDREGPLRDGEEQRAAQWARGVAAAV